MYYLHGDHLGTTSFVTDDTAVPTQFFLNLPFGETFAEQQIQGKYENLYKFNAKELDSETGLYYYGARYYNPRLSIWYGVDPIAIWNPVMEDEFYGDGQHNGGIYNHGNLNPYVYTYQNPVKYIDPNGKQVNAVDPYKGVGQIIARGASKLWNGIKQGWSQQYSTKTNSDKYGGLTRYRQWQGNPGYNEGEGKYDRIARLMGNSHHEEMLDFGGGGYNMYGGYGKVSNLIKVKNTAPQIGEAFRNLGATVADGNVSLSGRAVAMVNLILLLQPGVSDMLVDTNIIAIHKKNSSYQ